VAGGEEAFAEVTSDDFFGIADCGEVDAGVPAEKYIDVRRYMLELRGRENSRFLTGPLARFGMTRVLGSGRVKEWFEQFGDAGIGHEVFDCRLVVLDWESKIYIPSTSSEQALSRKTRQGWAPRADFTPLNQRTSLP
jgi:hypothetical protein